MNTEGTIVLMLFAPLVILGVLLTIGVSLGWLLAGSAAIGAVLWAAGAAVDWLERRHAGAPPGSIRGL